MKQLLLIGFGGFIGSVARHWVSKLNISWMFYNIPMGTLVVNIVGSLLIGFIAGLFAHSVTSNESLKLFLITGICGGFTTFSAFTFENVQLIQSGHSITAIIYISISVIFGIMAVIGGFSLSKILI